ncbi:MAG: hypothetical protein C0399_11895 [Syntrophus sp. (in: bacteria)]|nr:hypothetical protein [Syntrophus sp. (in: bacteria)]MBA4418987.1 hypothetical protein [Syntrophus sp. (in: bacteria)]
MKRKISSIVQHKDGWHGVSFSISGHEITDFEIYQKSAFDDIQNILKDSTAYSVSMNTSSGYMVHLTFPFNGKRKIGLVLNNELGDILPFGVEDVQIDFQEIGKGNVLSVAIPKDTLDGFRGNKKINILTLNTLAALHALRWLTIMTLTDYAFVNIDGNTASIMVFKENRLKYLRQFFYSPESDSLIDAFEELLSRKELIVTTYYMIGSNKDVNAEKERIEKNFNVEINTPSLKTYVKHADCPEWLWAGIGAALLSMNPKHEISLLSDRHRELSSFNRIALSASGVIAAICIIIVSVFYLNYYLKERAYNYLISEQGRLYRSAFPKAPPVKDIGKAFEDRIKSIDQELHGAGINVAMPPLQVLAEISSNIDSQTDVKLNEFVCDEKEFDISGTTVSFAVVEKIQSNLAKIKGVKSTETQSVDITAGKQIRFKIRGKL